MPLSKTRREYDLLDTHDIEEGETGRKKYSTTLAFKVSIIANIILVVLLVLKESLTGWNGSDCYQSSKPEINSMMKELSSYCMYLPNHQSTHVLKHSLSYHF